MRLNRMTICGAALIGTFLATSSRATTPEELLNLPTASVCFVEQGIPEQMAKARDAGKSAESTQDEAQRAIPGWKIPDALVKYVYGHPDVSAYQMGYELGRYVLWACNARVHGIPPLPLESVQSELRECGKGFMRGSCTKQIFNRVQGRPADYAAPESTPAPAPAK